MCMDGRRSETVMTMHAVRPMTTTECTNLATTDPTVTDWLEVGWMSVVDGMGIEFASTMRMATRQYTNLHALISNDQIVPEGLEVGGVDWTMQ